MLMQARIGPGVPVCEKLAALLSSPHALAAPVVDMLALLRNKVAQVDSVFPQAIFVTVERLPRGCPCIFGSNYCSVRIFYSQLQISSARLEEHCLEAAVVHWWFASNVPIVDNWYQIEWFGKVLPV